MELKTMIYQRKGRVAHIIFNRPERGNGITGNTGLDLQRCVEMANLDRRVHVIGLSGRGKGFCGGYDLVLNAEQKATLDDVAAAANEDHALSPLNQARNHDPSETWDPVLDYQMMSRNVKGFMSLFFSDKPVVTKAHGFCVAGGTDLALCSDLIITEENAKFGYPPARVWGTPTTALWVARLGIERAKRLLLTGDLIDGRTAYEWNLCTECVPADKLDEAFEALLQRIALMPVNQLIMQKLVCNQAILQSGLLSNQVLSVYFDGISRHTKEGYAFQQTSMERGFKAAVHERDAPYEANAAKIRRGTSKL